MAIDVLTACTTASDESGGVSQLALALSITFTVYVGSSIILSALTLFNSSHKPVAARGVTAINDRLDVSLLRARAIGLGK